MNLFHLIDEVAKLPIVWEVQSFSNAIRCQGRCPLQHYVGSDRDFKSTVGVLLEKGYKLEHVRSFINAADGYLFRELPGVKQYRAHMLRSFKFTEEAKRKLAKEKDWA